MNLSGLRAYLLAEIGRAPSDIVYELVENDIANRLRLREMEATTTITEAASVTLPSDFLEVMSVYRDTDPRTYLRSPPDRGHRLDRRQNARLDLLRQPRPGFDHSRQIGVDRARICADCARLSTLDRT